MPKRRYVICVANGGCEDLQPWKVYRALPDAEAAHERLVRVVDDSGEDYLYPSQRFIPIELPPLAQRRLAKRAAAAS